MTFKKIQLIIFSILFTALISSCNKSNDYEESIIIYDNEKYKKLIHMLSEENIEYKTNNENQVFYPTNKKESVMKAFEAVTGKKVPTYIPPQ